MGPRWPAVVPISWPLVTSDLLALAATLVAIPSESLDEGRLADMVEAELRQVPWLTVDRFEHNVVARTMLGRSHRVLLAGHLDTVPANNNTEARIVDDRLYGLGACDMKCSLAAMLEVARTVEPPTVDVTFVFYAAEEIASEHNGLLHLFDHRPELLDCDLALLGEPTSAQIEAGCQGTLRVKVTYRGERAHTARPWKGRNAIHRLGDLLSRLDTYEGRRPMIGGCEFREALQAVYVDGGVAGNVVPDSASVTINHRFAPDRSNDEAVAHVRDFVGECDGFELTAMSSAAYPATDHPLVAGLIERLGLEVSAKLGWTDVARFSEHGIPAANFGSGDASLAHTKDEYVERAEIERVYAVLLDLLTTPPG